MIKMVVFDMAGTVVDEHNIVYKTLHKSLVENGVPVSFEFVLRHGAGKEKKEALAEIMRLLDIPSDPGKLAYLYGFFRECLASAYADADISPQNGAEDLFVFLRSNGIRIVLNTGYDRATAEHLLDKLDWQMYRDIDLLVTASDVVAARPAPDMIQQAMSYFSIEHPYYVIKVGDSIIDIEEGKNADCRYVVGITTGAHTHDQLQEANPTHIIADLAQLKEIIVHADGA